MCVYTHWVQIMSEKWSVTCCKIYNWLKNFQLFYPPRSLHPSNCSYYAVILIVINWMTIKNCPSRRQKFNKMFVCLKMESRLEMRFVLIISKNIFLRYHLHRSSLVIAMAYFHKVIEHLLYDDDSSIKCVPIV